MNKQHRISINRIMMSASICFAPVAVCHAANGNGAAYSAEVLAGQQDSVDVTSLYATITTPPDYPVMIHFEGVLDDAEGDSLQGIGGHFYIKQGDWGLAGITAMRASVDLAETDDLPAMDDLQVSTFGLEVEGQTTSLLLALQTGRINSSDIEFDKDYYNNLELHWYATKQWSFLGGSYQFGGETTNFIEANYSYFLNGDAVSAYVGSTWVAFENNYLGLEYNLGANTDARWSFFVEFDNGEDGYDAVFIGVRFGSGPEAGAPVLSLFDRNTGGYSFVSTHSSSSQISKGMGKHD